MSAIADDECRKDLPYLEEMELMPFSDSKLLGNNSYDSTIRCRRDPISSCEDDSILVLIRDSSSRVDSDLHLEFCGDLFRNES